MFSAGGFRGVGVKRQIRISMETDGEKKGKGYGKGSAGGID